MVSERFDLFIRMVEISAGFMGWDTVPGDPDFNSEYLRGQAELICDTVGISTEYKEAVEILIIRHTQRDREDSQAIKVWATEILLKDMAEFFERYTNND